jgi:2-haloacid dehalogenase
MAISRRDLIKITTSALVVADAGSSAATSVEQGQIKAVAFDGFPIFDPRFITARCETLFPGWGLELSHVWRTKQFEYTWLRTVMQRYRDFLGIIKDALIASSRSLGLELTERKQKILVESNLQFKTWPDVVPALTTLKAAGIRLAYQMGSEAFGLRRDEILFAAFAAFGYPTFWVNRRQQSIEELDVFPDGAGTGMKDLLGFLRL